MKTRRERTITPAKIFSSGYKVVRWKRESPRKSHHTSNLFLKEIAKGKRSVEKNCTLEKSYNNFGRRSANIDWEKSKRERRALLLHAINNNFFRCVYFRSPPTFSQFQINSSTHQQQTVTEYAKPNQGISYSHQETTIHHNDQLDSMLGLYTEAKPSQRRVQLTFRI